MPTAPFDSLTESQWTFVTSPAVTGPSSAALGNECASGPEEWENISIHEAVQHVWQLLRMAQQFPMLTLHRNVERGLTVLLPPVLLEQVLANLILNAAQAGASTLWIDASASTQGVRITLQDNGGGIEDVLLHQAFQPFKTSRKEGMGLGLVICQRLVRYGQGEINLRNQSAPDGLPGVAVVLDFTQQEDKGRHGDNSFTR